MTDVTLGDQLQQARVHADAGQWDQADALLRQILTADPQRAEAHHLLGLVAWRRGEMHSALASLQHAATLKPDSPVFQFDLGCALLGMQQFSEAAVVLRKVVQLAPNERGGWNNLGAALVALGEHEQAAQCFARAIQIAPQLSQYHANLAKALEVLGRFREAEASARRAVELSPQGGSEWGVLASVLMSSGRYAGASDAYRRALALAPQMHLLRFNLANTLRLQGAVEESIAVYRDAVARDPGNARGHSGLLLTLHCSTAITPMALAQEHRAWAERHADSFTRDVRPHTNDRSPGRRPLRIGYVSPDFREHAVAHFIEPALMLDPSEFEVFCYVEEFHCDDVTRRLKSLVPHWLNTVPLNDDQLAQRIRADGIDILVDLAGHTADDRLLVFARKPAPVQATYLGYPNTSGMAAMDWRITDKIADPKNFAEPLHRERLMRLADCAWCYRPPEDSPEPIRDAAGESTVTFSSFNALPKVSDAVIALWSRILATVGGSKLLMKSAAFEDERVRERYRSAFARNGIAPHRLDLILTTPSVREHLAMYSRVDIALDTMPYNGTTTTCEALWMGVPVVTLAGESHVSRVGASLLTNAGLAELVGSRSEDYVSIAVKLAADPTRRAELRSTLRRQLRTSPLMDAARMTRELGNAYRAMWRDWINSGRT
jgi:protein O-GlcNAc transferase